MQPGWIPTRFHVALADKLQKAYENLVNGVDGRLIIEAPPQHGKLCSHSTRVLTTFGWTTHGKLKVGDFVFGRDGKPKKVIALSEESMSEYDIAFTDGQTIQCHGNHEWVIWNRDKKKEEIVETKWLASKKLDAGPDVGRGHRWRYLVDSNVGVELPKVELSLHPYVLGAWLGDGQSSGSILYAGDGDNETIEKCLEYFEVSSHQQHKITKVHSFYFSGLLKKLQQLNLINNKHIPDQYLISSKEQRLELLAGLIDTDGYVYHKNGRITFSNTNKRLIEDVRRLVVSLGWKVTVCEFEPIVSTSGIKGKQVVYQLCFQPTYKIPVAIPRKKLVNFQPEIRRRGIVSVKRAKKPELGRCIQVEGGIYLVGETLIPTHNSTIVSEFFPAWILGKQDWPVICASYGMSLAEKKSENTRNVVSSEIYQYIFPKTRLNPDSTSKEYWQTSTRGSYKAVGRGGGLTGNPGKVLIADDLIADKDEANSEVIREGAWDWWNTVFYTRKQENSLIILVETRWHLDDPAGKLEEQERKNIEAGKLKGTYDEWEKLTFAAIAEQDEYIDGKLFRKAGEPLAPERFSLSSLMKTKNAYSATNKIGDWAALYMQQPIIAENAEFRKEWFRYYDPEILKDKRLYYTTTVDLAISQKKSADNTVVMTVAKEVDGPNWYIVDITAGKMDNIQTVDAIFWHYEKYRSKIYIEALGYQASLQYSVLAEQRKRNIFFSVEDLKIKTTSKKEERIRGLVYLYKAGVIFHRKGICEQLELEEMQFPKGRHDDHPDALSMHLGIVRQAPRENPEEDTHQDGRLNWKRKPKVDPNFDPNKAFDRV